MKRQTRSSFTTTRFLIVAAVGSVLMALVCTFAPQFAQIAVLGTYISILAGLVLSLLEREAARDQQISAIFQCIGLPRRIARDSEVFEKYEEIVEGIAKSLNIDDPLFREMTLDQLRRVGEQTELLSQGRLEFFETETWRIAYERLLRCDEVRRYYSVALVSTDNYWQNAPGRQSIALNYQLQDEKGLSVERMVIISDELWPPESALPNEPVASWIYDQHNHGIWIQLIRESALKAEPNLVVDTGIYGKRATGTQFLDSQSRTVKFILSFNPDDLGAAKKRWERLSLFAVSFRELLDRN